MTVGQKMISFSKKSIICWNEFDKNYIYS